MSPNSEMDVDGLVQPPKPSPPALAPVASPQNGKLISPITETAAATALPPSPTSTSASALASLLSSTLAQVESLKERLKKEKRRADHFEGLATDYKDLLNEGTEAESAKKPADGEDKADVAMESSAASQLATAAEKIRQLRESVAAAEEVRDEEMARRLAITDLWAQLNQYIDRLESAGRDVRAGFDRVVKHGGGVLRDYGSMFKDIPQLSEGDLMRVDRNYNANGVLQPLGPSRRHEYSHGTRRPRSGSMDAYAYSSGPNSKRVRYQNEHPHPQAYYQHPPPPPGNPLSPPTHIQHAIIQNVPFSQGQPQPPSLAGSSSGSGSGSRHRHGDPSAMPPPPDHMYAVPGPPGYEHSYRSQDQPREYREDRRRRRRDRSRSFPRSPSRGSEGSLDLDEMLLAATSADEQHLQANGNAVPGQPVLVSGRRKDRSHGSVIYDPRDGAQFVHQVPPHSVSPHAQHITAHHSSHHLVGGPPPPPHVAQYPQTSSERHSPSFSSGSRPSSSRRHREALRAEPTLRDDLGHAATGPGQVQYQTHVFAPVQTGAPVKKTKFNNTGSGANIAEEPHSNSPAPNPPVAISTSTNSLPLASVNLAPATSPFPPTNEQGQRICRQCGMPGRYKEGKCVEKWGPGPMGPGTVCDRCRKKMKRVERRGTIEQAQLLAAQQAQNRTQPNIGNTSSYGSFSTPQREGSIAKLGRTDTVIVDSRDGSRLAYDEPSVSSLRSTSNARVVTSVPFSKPSKTGSASRATSKANSRAGSIVDGSKTSRRSSPLPPSRLNLGASASTPNPRTHTSNASVHSNGSGSGMDIDADADGDAEADLDDAEAEVEGDLAALVDLQAGSSPSHSGGSRHTRANDEDVDIAVLAGVEDDDPDDYDSPATMNALKRQQAARATGPSVKTEVNSGPSPSSADGDAELDILEAVDAAEANSAASSSGLKVEDA